MPIHHLLDEQLTKSNWFMENNGKYPFDEGL